MSLADANKKLKYDKRLTERNLTTGEISKDQYETFLKELPDLSHNIETVSLEKSADDEVIETH